MAGTFKKGTNDADGNGEKGGSLKAATAPQPAPKAPAPEPAPKAAPESPRVAALEAEVAAMKEVMRRNGWSL